MLDESPLWVSVAFPPTTSAPSWRAFTVRLTAHAGGRPGHHWWPFADARKITRSPDVTAYLDAEGNVAAVEITSPTLQGLGAALDSADLYTGALGSPTLFCLPESHEAGGGWVWPFAEVSPHFPFNREYRTPSTTVDVNQPEGRSAEVLLLPTFAMGGPWRDSSIRRGDLAYCVVVDHARGHVRALPSKYMGPEERSFLEDAVRTAQNELSVESATVDRLEYGIHLPTLYRPVQPEVYASVTEAEVRARTLLEFEITEHIYRSVGDGD